MNISIFIKKYVAYPVSLFKIFGNYGNISGGNTYVILLYHRIIEKDPVKCYVQDGMYVKPETFNNHIKYIKKYYNVISLEDLFSDKNIVTNRTSNSPYCILTFDDGWKDFYDNAYPILRNHDVCATVFLPTDFIGTNQQLWTDHLAHIINNRKNFVTVSESLPESMRHYFKYIYNIKGFNENRIEKSIKLLKILPLEQIENLLQILGDSWQVDLKEKERCFLTWDEVKEMHASGLVQFGSHSKRHKILTTVSDKGIWDELVQSRTRLLEEKVANPSFLSFSYPNGNFTPEIARMVEEAGYNVALTTIKGWNRLPDNRSDGYQLKRIGIHESITSTNHMLACRLQGIY